MKLSLQFLDAVSVIPVLRFLSHAGLILLSYSIPKCSKNSNSEFVRLTVLCIFFTVKEKQTFMWHMQEDQKSFGHWQLGEAYSPK